MKNKTFRNISIGIVLQLVIALSGIIVPKLILSCYGSTINGLIVSINQLISYLALVEAGVGSVAIVALYSPLSDNNRQSINEILSASHKLYKKSGIVYLFLVIFLSFIYPFFVNGQVNSLLVTSMFFVLSTSNLIDYLFLGKYKVLLTADEKLYIVNGLQIFSVLLNTVITVFLVLNNFDILLIKSLNIFICVLRLIIVKLYVRKNYSYINLSVKADYSKLSQRWDSLVHQITAIITGNTDILLITILLGSSSLLEVSVYSVYNMVVVAISGLFGTLSSSLQAYFGKLISVDSSDLSARFEMFENIYFPILFSVMCCVSILILPFITLYTQNVNDINYYRPLVAFFFVFNAIIQNIRIPGITLICSAGKFKETRNRSIMEAVINLTISIMLIPKFGILGALIGTSFSYLYRTFDVIVYSNNFIKNYSLKNTFKKLFINTFCFFLCLFLVIVINHYLPINGWMSWVFAGVIDYTITTIVFFTVNFVLNKNMFFEIRKL